MTFEVCADSLETALLADRYGCHRVELCSALSVGGLTPSYGLIKQCVDLTDLEIHVMIRHQEGHFVLSDNDLNIMIDDIELAGSAGANGVVFGSLTDDHQVDIETSKQLVQKARSLGLTVTFHRAFDIATDPIQALNELICIGG